MPISNSTSPPTARPGAAATAAAAGVIGGVGVGAARRVSALLAVPCGLLVLLMCVQFFSGGGLIPLVGVVTTTRGRGVVRRQDGDGDPLASELPPLLLHDEDGFSLADVADADTGGGIPSTRLRFDWSDLTVSSPLGRYWHDHQRNCSLPRLQFQFRNRNGLGHELYMWTQALCNAAQAQYRIHTALPWGYRDAETCQNVTLTTTHPDAEEEQAPDGNQTAATAVSAPSSLSALQCYFPAAEPECPNDYEYGPGPDEGAVPVPGRELDPPDLGYFYPPADKGNVVLKQCESLMTALNASYLDVRASAIEYLFASASQVLVNEALRQLNVLFGGVDVKSYSRLVTVHVRWGDKKAEMELLPISDYVRAVQTLLNEPRAERGPPREAEGGGKVGIFLATEDPGAAQEFQIEAAKHNWTVFVDVYQQEFEQFRVDRYNGNPRMAKKLQGRPGLVALASLLVAMQANDFVLTTRSNWSRLMNELRKNVVDPRCNNCTKMIDLHSGEW